MINGNSCNVIRGYVTVHAGSGSQRQESRFVCLGWGKMMTWNNDEAVFGKRSALSLLVSYMKHRSLQIISTSAVLLVGIQLTARRPSFDPP